MRSHSNCFRKFLVPVSVLCLALPALRAEQPASAPVATGDFGPASFLPADTDYFLGAYNLGAHTDAVKQSRFWQKLTKAAGDNITASPSAQSNMEDALRLVRKEAFLSFPGGSAKSFASMMELSRLINYYRIESLLVSPNMGGNIELEQIMAMTLADAKTRDFLSNFEIPALTVGFHVGPDAAEVLGQLMPPEKIDQALAQEPRLKKEDFQTADGSPFTAYTLTAGDFMTEPIKETLLKAAPEDQVDAVKAMLEKVAAKKVVLSVGVYNKEWILLTLGANHDHLVFAQPGASLRNTPQFKKLDPYASSNLAFAFCATQSAIESLMDRHPLTPTLTAVVDAFKDQEAFAKAAEKLQEKIPALETAEAALLPSVVKAGSGVGYIDEGLHIETFDGPVPPQLSPDQPNRFSSLVAPDALLAFSCSGNRTYHTNLHQFIETLATTIQDVATVALASPAIDKETAQGINVSSLMFIPMVKTLWTGILDISAGSGTQAALIVDDQGVVPAPMKEKMGENAKLPRLTFISEIKDRASLAKGWASIQGLITQILAISGRGLPPGMELFAASEENGFTQHTLNLPPLIEEDVLIGSTLNDSILTLGTDQKWNAKLAADAKTIQGKENGANFHLNVAKIRNLLNNNTQGTQDAEMTKVLEWLSTVDFVDWKTWSESDAWRVQFHLKFQDLQSFD